ncbi:uncharacterized protein [Callorhinus ursinus]|uniref:uncharacterized protein isoform X2 n=1 Tax=Callorhinus ursinus TaxID=34884 RepID=UPI003CD00BED
MKQRDNIWMGHMMAGATAVILSPSRKERAREWTNCSLDVPEPLSQRHRLGMRVHLHHEEPTKSSTMESRHEDSAGCCCHKVLTDQKGNRTRRSGCQQAECMEAGVSPKTILSG